MDTSRFNTLSLNNSHDIIANSISLIQGDTVHNILDLFANGVSNDSNTTQINNIQSMVNSNTLSIQTIQNSLNSNISAVIGINGLNIYQINNLQASLDLRALITKVYNKTETYTKSEADTI